jgi:putative spermidine/putrescine transport system permease protein
MDGLNRLLFSGPLLLFVGAFLLLPSLQIGVSALSDGHGGLTLRYVEALGQPQYRTAFQNSVVLSGTTALLGGILGSLLAFLAYGRRGRLAEAVTAFSGVAANFAGVPLAFAFIATLGTTGLLTQFLKRALGLDLYGSGFSLFSYWGLVVVYLYFQIPLMFLVMTPAVAGLRREWREAAEGLGATPFQYWTQVVLPLILPAALAGTILLFGNAFSAYATPYALTSGVLPLVPLQIGSALQGNVAADPQQGAALALGMVALMLVSLGLYFALERRNSRWRQR